MKVGYGHTVWFTDFLGKRANRVPRFSQFLVYSEDKTIMIEQLDNYLREQKFFPILYRAEKGIYSKGDGKMTSIKYIKVLPLEDGILVESFVDVYGYESGLKGAIASLPKKHCKKIVDEIIMMIEKSNMTISDNKVI